MEGLQDGDAHLTAGEVVVGAVDDVFLVPQEIETDEERHEKEAVHAHLGQQQSGRAAEDAAVLDHGGDGDAEGVEQAAKADDSMGFEADTAEQVVDGPFPDGVAVAVEEDALFDFALRFLDGHHVMPCCLFEEPVHELLVHTELQQGDECSQTAQDGADDRREPVSAQRDEDEGDGKVEPAEEAVRMLLELLDDDLFTAVLLTELCVIFTGLEFALGTGRSFFECLDDVGDVPDDPVSHLIFFIDQLFESHFRSTLLFNITFSRGVRPG